MKLQVDYDNDRNVCVVQNGGVHVSVADNPAGFPLVELVIPQGIEAHVVLNASEVLNTLPPPPVVNQQAATQAANKATREMIAAQATADMQAWSDVNPGATKSEIVKAALKIGAHDAIQVVTPDIADPAA